MDQGNDLPIHQGVPAVKTTLWHENALCLLPCFHVGSPPVYLLGDSTILNAILGGRTDLPHFRLDI
jgi:hypothetical protein